MTYRRPQSENELVELVRSIDVRAPDSIHSEVQAMVARRSRPRRVGDRVAGGFARGLAPRFAAAGAAVAAVAVAVAVAVSGGGSGAGAPTLRGTAALTLLPATAGPPPESKAHRADLDAAVEGVSFPYWKDALGWRSTGTRSDRLGGRMITTVFYSNGKGGSVGYAIVGGHPAPRVTGGTTAIRAGTPYRLFTQNGRPVVTWLRDGHMCVVSGQGVTQATLLKLASWGASVAA
jgi:hypothetical protein